MFKTLMARLALVFYPERRPLLDSPDAIIDWKTMTRPEPLFVAPCGNPSCDGSCGTCAEYLGSGDLDNDEVLSPAGTPYTSVPDPATCLWNEYLFACADCLAACPHAVTAKAKRVATCRTNSAMPNQAECEGCGIFGHCPVVGNDYFAYLNDPSFVTDPRR